MGVKEGNECLELSTGIVWLSPQSLSVGPVHYFKGMYIAFVSWYGPRALSGVDAQSCEFN